MNSSKKIDMCQTCPYEEKDGNPEFGTTNSSKVAKCYQEFGRCPQRYQDELDRPPDDI